MNQKSMLYVHIPFCMQKCRYCDFLSFPASEENRQLYIDEVNLILNKQSEFYPQLNNLIVDKDIKDEKKKFL